MNEFKKKLYFSLMVFLLMVLFAVGFGFTGRIAHGKSSDAYMVIAGDTLSEIANRYGMTWEDLWKLNPQIKDPHWIFPGDKIQLRLIKKTVSEAEFSARLTKFMFKVSGLREEEKSAISAIIAADKQRLVAEGMNNMFYQREVMDRLYTNTRKYEIHQLVEGILYTANRDWDIACKLTALSWLESHFVNRLGKKAEVGFYQFLPSTVMHYFPTAKADSDGALFTLANNHVKASEFAWALLSDHPDIKAGIKAYNHGAEYPGIYFRKLERVRKELLK